MRKTTSFGITEDASFRHQKCTRKKKSFWKKFLNQMPKTTMHGAIESGWLSILSFGTGSLTWLNKWSKTIHLTIRPGRTDIFLLPSSGSWVLRHIHMRLSMQFNTWLSKKTVKTRLFGCTFEAIIAFQKKSTKDHWNQTPRNFWFPTFPS